MSSLISGKIWIGFDYNRLLNVIAMVLFSLPEDGSESFSVVTTSMHHPLESDDADQEKNLLSPSGGDVTIVKEDNR